MSSKDAKKKLLNTKFEKLKTIHLQIKDKMFKSALLTGNRLKKQVYLILEQIDIILKINFFL